MLLFTWQKNIHNLPRGGDGGGGGGGSSSDLAEAYQSAKESAGLLSDMAKATADRGFYSDSDNRGGNDRGADIRTGDSVGGLRGDTGYYSQKVDKEQAVENRAIADAVDAAQAERQDQEQQGHASLLDRALNIANEVIGVKPAQASFATTQDELDIAGKDAALREKINNFNQLLSSGASKEQAAAAYPEVGRLLNISPANIGFDAASAAAGFTPTKTVAEPLAQAAGTYTRPFDVAQAAGTPTSPYELSRAAGTPTSPYELAQAAGTPTSPYELAQAAGTYTSPYELARAAGTPTSPYELAQAAGTYTSPYNVTPASGFDAASAAAQLSRVMPPEQIAINNAKRVAAASGDDSATQKFPANPPMPPIPYRDLGAGNILDNVLKVFGMDTESWINRKAAEYEKQGMSPSDAAIKASYDLRDLQMNMQNRDDRGGGRDNVQAVAPVLPPPVKTTAATPAAPIAKLPGVGTPYIPPGVTPYVAPLSGQPRSSYADLGAAASVQRQVAYNQAIDNAMRLLGLA